MPRVNGVKTVRQYCANLKTWLATSRVMPRGHADTVQFVDIDLDAMASPPREGAFEPLGDPWRTQPAVRRKPSS